MEGDDIKRATEEQGEEEEQMTVMACHVHGGGRGLGVGRDERVRKGGKDGGGGLPACTCECDPVKWAPCVTECMLHHVVWRGCGVVILCTVVIFHSSPPPLLGE